MVNKFKEIFRDLEQKILDQEYPPQSLLPSENQLIQIYGVSRETVRKALNLLKEAGYIQKKQGKGSIVLDRNRFEFPISGLTSFKELEHTQSIPNETIVVSLEKLPVTDYLHQRTHWPLTETCWKLVRQRKIGGEVVIVDRDFLDTRIVPRLPQAKAQDSIYDYLENDLGYTIAYSHKEITVDPVTKEVAQLMDLAPEEQHVVVVRSIVFLEDTRCFQYNESIHRLDKFRFVDFARRQKI